MIRTLKDGLLGIVFSMLALTLYAEGTKELLVENCTNHGYIQIWSNNDSLRNFAVYGCPAPHRLNITMNAGESLFFGFATDTQDVYYQLRDPDGNIVMGPSVLNPGSAGWINNCEEAITGPDSLYANGYRSISHKAEKSGDYYIEFAVNNDNRYYRQRRLLYFDATVAFAGSVKTGRVWSKAWDISTGGTDSLFSGVMYDYTQDSVVNELSFSGMQPGSFVLSVNANGASTAGTTDEQRRSDYRQHIIDNGGIPGNPQFSVFLNQPDENLFPVGSLGKIDSIGINPGYGQESCVYLNVTKPGTVVIHLVFANGSHTRELKQDVNAGENCISWDGYDGMAKPVPSGTNVQVQVSYLSEITQLSLTGVANNLGGITSRVVKPVQPGGLMYPAPDIYWNDSLLADPQNSVGDIANTSGIEGPAHQWQGRSLLAANPEVMNTWWYNGSSADSANRMYFHGSFALPVVLVSFSGQYNGGMAVLNWQMSYQDNLDFFAIERSADGVNFMQLGKVPADNGQMNYLFNDSSMAEAGLLSYYRLRMVTYNRDSAYSPVISVSRTMTKAGIQLKVYPNPAHRQFVAEINMDDKKDVHVEITDISGKVINETTYRGMAGTNVIPVDMGTEQPGIYFVVITNGIDRVVKCVAGQ